MKRDSQAIETRVSRCQSRKGQCNDKSVADESIGIWEHLFEYFLSHQALTYSCFLVLCHKRRHHYEWAVELLRVTEACQRSKIIAPIYERMKDMAFVVCWRREGGGSSPFRRPWVSLLFSPSDRREKSERIEIVWISIEAFGQKFLIGNLPKRLQPRQKFLGPFFSAVFDC